MGQSQRQLHTPPQPTGWGKERQNVIPVYSYELSQTEAGQWKYSVIENDDGIICEVQGGAGYETEDAADYDAWLAVAEWRGRIEGPI